MRLVDEVEPVRRRILDKGAVDRERETGLEPATLSLEG